MPFRLCSTFKAAFITVFVATAEAHAASAVANVPIILAVVAPVCTVSNNAASVILPPASSTAMTQDQWLTANGITTTAVVNSAWKTSASLNQTATISCNSPAATISSVLVQPGAGASLVSTNTATQFLVDAAVPPFKAAGGNLIMAFEQVSINGASAIHSYQTNANPSVPQSYSIPFNTVSAGASSSTATVVWRPTLSNENRPTALGTPSGGSFMGSAQIVINY